MSTLSRTGQSPRRIGRGPTGRRMAALALSAITVLALAACGEGTPSGTGGGEGGTLVFWTAEDIAERVAATQAIVDGSPRPRHRRRGGRDRGGPACGPDHGAQAAGGPARCLSAPCPSGSSTRSRRMTSPTRRQPRRWWTRWARHLLARARSSSPWTDSSLGSPATAGPRCSSTARTCSRTRAWRRHTFDTSGRRQGAQQGRRGGHRRRAGPADAFTQQTFDTSPSPTAASSPTTPAPSRSTARHASTRSRSTRT